MRIIQFEVTGMKPGLLMHSPAGMKRTDGPGSGLAKAIPTAETEAEGGAYRLPSGQLYIPAYAFRASILTASKGRKIGKNFARSIFQSCLFENGEDMVAPLYEAGTKAPLSTYEIDVRRVRIGKSGVMRARAFIQDWACRVSFEYDDERLAPETIAEVFAIAGKTVGVLDYRPTSSGPFGRYLVELLP